METIQMSEVIVELAPDGSKIQSLLRMKGGSLAYRKLPPGAISKVVVHKSIEEIWFFLQGRGQVWREKSG